MNDIILHEQDILLQDVVFQIVSSNINKNDMQLYNLIRKSIFVNTAEQMWQIIDLIRLNKKIINT